MQSGAGGPAAVPARGASMAGWVTARGVAARAGILLIASGGMMVGVVAAAQRHAPQPGPPQAGSIGRAAPAPVPYGAPHGDRPARARSRALPRSLPVSISIPAIGVDSPLLRLGRNPDGTIAVPPLNDPPVTNEAAWYKYSPAPGRPGAAVIVGHVDSASDGPSVFFRLGALDPGDEVNITLADHQTAVFKITGVRIYPKDRFPAATVYGPVGYPALRLITCGGSFDEQTGSYLSNVVAFAALVSSHPA